MKQHIDDKIYRLKATYICIKNLNIYILSIFVLKNLIYIYIKYICIKKLNIYIYIC